MKQKLLTLTLASVMLAGGASVAAAEIVNSLAPKDTNFTWADQSSGGGSAQIVDLTGQGGDLENNAPAGKGALALSTGGSGDDRGEVRYTGNFGTIGDFLQSGSMSYNYYHNSGAPLTSIVPAIKFEVWDFTDNNSDPYATFVYEPVYNAGGVGAFDSWHEVNIDGNTGDFWHTTLYDMNGALYDNSIADWAAAYSSFSDAIITSIILGVGSGTPNQSGYVDDVYFRNGDIELAADFEVSAVPLPAALPLYGAGMAILGFLGWRKKRKLA
ncbi:hypothetical protein [Sneathiella limimaris]|uniref:hypothetical protein n=1 Tax=Sneathiella limimaris TaxID=1964213 RepID=UPI00146AB5C4|nr:hypothetical protein [Sneathiella limimaris]